MGTEGKPETEKNKVKELWELETEPEVKEAIETGRAYSLIGKRSADLNSPLSIAHQKFLIYTTDSLNKNITLLNENLVAHKEEMKNNNEKNAIFTAAMFRIAVASGLLVFAQIALVFFQESKSNQALIPIASSASGGVSSCLFPILTF